MKPNCGFRRKPALTEIKDYGEKPRALVCIA
jgi:hypothetical protein